MADTQDDRDASNQEIVVVAGSPIKSRSRFLWVLLPLGGLVIGIAIAIWLVYLRGLHQSPVADNSPQYSSPQALIDAASPLLRGKVVEPARMTGLGGMAADGSMLFSPPSYHPPNAPFSILPTKSTGAAVQGDARPTETSYTALVDFLSRNHFTRQTTGDGPTYISFTQQVTTKKYAVYHADTMSCALMYADALQSSIGAYITSIACGSRANYEAAATSLRPFYEAYKNADDGTAKNLVFGNVDIADGEDGYKNALIYQEDESQIDQNDDRAFFYGMYYQTPGDTKWSYFTSTREALSCTEYRSEAMQKAFRHLPCYDDATQTMKTV